MNRIESQGPRGPGRTRRAIAAIAKTAGLALAFVAAAGGGALLHLDLGAPRRFATARANSILEGMFQGKIVVERAGTLHLNHLAGIDAHVLDPEGHHVIHLTGVDVRLSPYALVRSLASGKRVVVRIPELTIDDVEATVEDDAAGDIGLVRAFDSRTPSTGGPGSDVSIAKIHVRHAWVHGHLAAVPVLDADLEDLDGALRSTPETTNVDVEHLFVRGRGLGGASPEGTVVAHAVLPAAPDGAKHVRGHYDGCVGEIPINADGSLEDQIVAATVDVPETAPTAFAALAPGQIHLGAPVSAHAEVHGALPTLRPDLHVTVGGGEIVASGLVTVPGKDRPDLTGTATVDVKDIDASVLQEGAPASRLTAHLEASVVSHPGGKLSGGFQLQTEVGQASGQVVPAIRARGNFTEASVNGSAHIAEQGAPATVAFSLHPRQGETSPTLLALTVDAVVPDLDAIPRAPHIGRGRVRAHVDADVELDKKRLTADARVDASGIAVSGVTLARGFVTAKAEGSFTSPHLSARVLGSDLRAGGYLFTDLRATASGSPQEVAAALDLTGSARAPSVLVRANVARGEDDLTVRATNLVIDRGDVHLRAKIPSIRVAGGVVDIRGVTATGLGDPIEATARIAPGSVTVKAKAKDIDLARVAQLAAREEDTRGHLALDVDATASRGGARGKVDVEARDLYARGVQGGAVHVSTSLEGSRLRGEVTAALGEVGKIAISAPDVTLRGSATDLAAWKKATGSLAIDGSVDVGRLMAQLPEGSRPLDAAAGTITIGGKAARPTLSDSPTVDLQVATKGLVLVGKRVKHRNADGTVDLGPDPWHTAGVDGTFGVKLTAATGQAQVSAEVHDARGPLVTVAAGARLPLDQIARAPDRFLSLAKEAPVEGKITVPRRSLDALPSAFGTLPVQGDIELAADLKGTARAPKLTLSAKGTSLTPRVAKGNGCVRPLDVEAKVDYDGEKAGVHLTASRDAHEVLTTAATVKVSAAKAMDGGPLAWEASSDVAFAAFPLDAVAPLIHQPIAGSLTGKVALKDLHRAASLEADLDVANLALDKASFPKGKVKVVLRDGALTTTARLDQADGYAEVGAKGNVAWGAAIAPSLDATKAIDATIRAQNLRAAAAKPFVEDTLSELDGRVDADAKVHVEPGGKDGKVTGAITLRDGVFEAPQLGERFHGVKGRLTMKPWGTVVLDGLSAQGSTGTLTASAQAELAGLSLKNASGKIHIAKGQSIPIAVQGVPMGRAYGDIVAKAQMSPDGKRLDVNLDVPLLHVDLPQSTGHSVQALDPDKTVRIGTHRGHDFVTLALAAPSIPRPPSSLLVHAVVKLGDIGVKRDTTVDVTVDGNTTIDVAEKTSLTGQINVKRGKLQLEGKEFIVDKGVVSFVGPDPANPQIVATAYWDAPDGTRVFADFSGQVTSGKLNLRSEPSLTQDEILSLILFGSSTGSLGASPPPGQEESAGVKAAGMAGGVVTQGLNKAISGVTSADISTRIDTSDADSPRPELAMQITKSIAARLSYKLGVPAPGENPDRTELTVDWRFIRNWSLVTVVGDQGSTALDVQWRLRY